MANQTEKRNSAFANRTPVEELKGQLLVLQCDLSRFTLQHSSPLLTASIKERIKDIEAQLAATAPRE